MHNIAAGLLRTSTFDCPCFSFQVGQLMALAIKPPCWLRCMLHGLLIFRPTCLVFLDPCNKKKEKQGLVEVLCRMTVHSMLYAHVLYTSREIQATTTTTARAEQQRANFRLHVESQTRVVSSWSLNGQKRPSRSSVHSFASSFFFLLSHSLTLLGY